MSLKLCKRKYGYLGNGLRNHRRCNRVSFCTCWIDDNDHLYRGPDVPDSQNRLHQVHFLPCGNENDRIKDSPTDLINSPTAIADFCHNRAPSNYRNKYCLSFCWSKPSFWRPTVPGSTRVGNQDASDASGDPG